MTQSCKVQRDHNQFYWRLDTWGLLALGLVGLNFLLRLHTLERIVTLCLFYWNVGLLSVFGDTWFVVCIACKCVIELWLVLWRDQYIYLLYQMEKKKKKKSHTVSLEGLVSHALDPFGFGTWQYEFLSFHFFSLVEIMSSFPRYY